VCEIEPNILGESVGDVGPRREGSVETTQQPSADQEGAIMIGYWIQPRVQLIT